MNNGYKRGEHGRTELQVKSSWKIAHDKLKWLTHFEVIQSAMITTRFASTTNPQWLAGLVDFGIWDFYRELSIIALIPNRICIVERTLHVDQSEKQSLEKNMANSTQNASPMTVNWTLDLFGLKYRVKECSCLFISTHELTFSETTKA